MTAGTQLKARKPIEILIYTTQIKFPVQFGKEKFKNIAESTNTYRNRIVKDRHSQKIITQHPPEINFLLIFCLQVTSKSPSKE